MSARRAEINSVISKIQESANKRYAEQSNSYMAGLLESLLTSSMMGMDENQYVLTLELMSNITNIQDER